MTPVEWDDPNGRALTIYLDGADDPDRAEDGSPLVDDDFLVLVNAWWQPLDFVVPPTRPDQSWSGEIDTFSGAVPLVPEPLTAGGTVAVDPRSVVVLRGSRTERTG